jgi:CRP/FNR family cyclic AMP-dependent transcriptional regulator
MPLLGLELKDTYAEVLEEATLSVLDRPALERLLVERPRLAVSLLESLGKRLVEAEASLEVAFRKVPARLACLVLRLAAEQGSTVQGFTHQQLADRIGTYRETVTMTLNLFKRHGLIEIGRKRLMIRDAQALREIGEEKVSLSLFKPL